KFCNSGKLMELCYYGQECDNSDIVSMFAKFFSGVYSSDVVIPPLYNFNNTVNTSCEFSTSEVCELLMGLK
ncbi:hypothetical protein HHI36_009505, partial [Cryptolaemus montrouzieri]